MTSLAALSAAQICARRPRRAASPHASPHDAALVFAAARAGISIEGATPLEALDVPAIDALAALLATTEPSLVAVLRARRAVLELDAEQREALDALAMLDTAARAMHGKFLDALSLVELCTLAAPTAAAAALRHRVTTLAALRLDDLGLAELAALAGRLDSDACGAEHAHVQHALGRRLPLNVSLLPLQLYGLAWMLWRERRADANDYCRGGILADDMGLGKTLQMLALAACDLPMSAPSDDAPWPGGTLVVAPLAALATWRDEAAARLLAPANADVLIYHGDARRRHPDVLTSHHLVLTTYGTLVDEGGASPLLAVAWRRVVLDEGHVVSTLGTETARAVWRLEATHRWVLSGTPLLNRTEDMLGLLQFLRAVPYCHADWFALYFESEKARVVRSLLLRREKSDLGDGVLASTEHAVWHDLRDWERVLYDTAARARDEWRAARPLDASTDEWMLRLRQLAAHWGLVLASGASTPVVQAIRRAILALNTSYSDEKIPWLVYNAFKAGEWYLGCDNYDECVEPARISVLVNDCVGAMAEGEKMLVFSQWRTHLDVAEHALRHLGTRRYDGTLSAQARAQALAAFRSDPGVHVLFATLKSGGVSLNLTVASHVVLLDPWWTPGIEEQAIDRVRRLGQTRHVHVWRLSARGTVEERVEEVRSQKRALRELERAGYRVIDGSAARDEAVVDE